ncbi:MAG TPA: squalene/phytoene synthase family protein [Gammaproteobacteria bacterium]|nr:squalene/phytoene synthase family protein [Gammaproteobacteria bacterium]
MSESFAPARLWCRERLADPAEDLGVALPFAPRHSRAALTALGAMYVEFETIATRFRELQVARSKLGWWRDELARLDAGRPEHPATRLLAASGVAIPLVAIGDLLGGFELILLGGPVNDLATATLRSELGFARFCFLIAQLEAHDSAPPELLARLGLALGLTRILRSPALDASARNTIARAARDSLAGCLGGLESLPQPLPPLAALARGDLERDPLAQLGRKARSARVLCAWRAARGGLPRSLRSA